MAGLFVEHVDPDCISHGELQLGRATDPERLSQSEPDRAIKRCLAASVKRRAKEVVVLEADNHLPC